MSGDETLLRLRFLAWVICIGLVLAGVVGPPSYGFRQSFGVPAWVVAVLGAAGCITLWVTREGE